MKYTSKSGWGGWGFGVVAIAAASTALAQQGTGTTAPQDKPAPNVAPTNTPASPDKTKPAAPAAPDTKATPKSAAIKVGDAAPEWSLKDSEGATLALKDLRGKVVLIDFWATWCGPCRQVMPEIQKLHEQYGDKGLVVLGMNSWEGRGKLAPEAADARAIQYKKDNKYTYRGLLRADEAAKAYGVTGIPAMFLVGPDGKLIGRWIGADSASVGGMKSGVKTALDELNKNKGATDATKPSDAKKSDK